MTPFYITEYDISYLACFANTLSPTYNIFQININPSRISHIYIHTEGPSASYIALLALSDVPQRVRRDSAPRSGCPDYLDFTESYYDEHTITTEICPDYYIYPLERSILLIISIMIDIRLVSRCVLQIYNSIQFNYEQYFIPYSLNVCLDQAPTLKSASKRRARQMARPCISRSPCMRRQDYHKLHDVNNTQIRITINKPAKPVYTYRMSHIQRICYIEEWFNRTISRILYYLSHHFYEIYWLIIPLQITSSFCCIFGHNLPFIIYISMLICNFISTFCIPTSQHGLYQKHKHTQ